MMTKEQLTEKLKEITARDPDRHITQRLNDLYEGIFLLLEYIDDENVKDAFHSIQTYE